MPNRVKANKKENYVSPPISDSASSENPAVPGGNCTTTLTPLPPGEAGCPLEPGNFTITCGWQCYCRADGYCHDAMDLGVPNGTPVYAAEDGVMSVYYSVRESGYGLGTYILLSTEHGVFMYAHLTQAIIEIGENKPVIKGDLIGWTDESGAPGQPHLHFGYYISTDINSSNARPIENLGIECIDQLLSP